MSTAPENFRLLVRCDIREVRSAIAIIRACLERRELSPSELSACELAVVEALNNAIEYASPAAAKLPVCVEISFTPRLITFRVQDHTAGFRLPDRIELPHHTAERGRGLFLMQTAMDEIRYECSKQDGNCLTMIKRRTARK